MATKCKIIVYVPTSHADIVRQAIGEVGAGKIGNYSYCSFSTKGISRYKPEVGANPTIGAVGTYEQVEEERIEVTCHKEFVNDVIMAMRRVHPYDEMAYDVYPLEDWV